MIAVRAAKPARSGSVTHALSDDGRWTRCGRRAGALTIRETLVLRRLPAVDGCPDCERILRLIEGAA